MKKEQINIRDPFVVCEDGKYYLFGTRANNFGICTGGFDVYISEDMENWSDPVECFNSERYGLNKGSNWAPEVHKYNGKYYMLATFIKDDGLRGTFSLCSDSVIGPFVPYSKKSLTPDGWECLDGTLYVEDGVPYLVFCHEHTQIIDGTMCYIRLNNDLSASVGEAVTLFAASSFSGVGNADKEDSNGESGHFVTDGPFMYRSKAGELLMIWSSFIDGNYAELMVRFKDGKLGTEFEHIEPLITNDGGHGMIFNDKGKTYFTYHTPNKKGYEHPEFCQIEDNGDTISCC